MLGLAPVVYGRIELGTRPARATELRDIARILGVSTDDLLFSASPVTPEQVVERAAARRDTAHRALRDYAQAVLEAVAAVEGSDHGAVIRDEQITDASDVCRWLESSAPLVDGVTARADLIAVVRAALDNLAGSVRVYAARGEDDDG